MLVPKLTVCMIHLFHSNAVKFNFLKKLFGCDCFDLDPETECKLFCRQVRHEVKIKKKNGVILSKFDRESPKVNQVIFSAPTSVPNMKALAQTRFEIPCIQDFQNLFSVGHYSNKRHNMYMKKYRPTIFS